MGKKKRKSKTRGNGRKTEKSRIGEGTKGENERLVREFSLTKRTSQRKSGFEKEAKLRKTDGWGRLGKMRRGGARRKRRKRRRKREND